MQSTVVESHMASTRRSLKESGFDDRQAQALVEMIGTAAERRVLLADVAELKHDVAELKHDVALLNERFDGLRGEIVARIEASEERVKNEIASVRSEAAAFRAEVQGDMVELRTETQGSIAELRAETQGSIAELRTEMQGSIAELRTEMQGSIAELRTEMRSSIAELRTEMRSSIAELRTETQRDIAMLAGRIDGLDGRLKLVLWFMGIGLTLYTGTTISLMILLFRNALA